MVSLNFIIDEKGNKKAVILPIEVYKEILEKLEELEEIKAYDEAKASTDEVVPFELAVKEIEDSRKF
ncbi:MAG TPA: hypothetical protein ENJ40_09130 [Thermosulfurimonas dismutans]|uniref:Uncharacterized protein n=1 Tax=Thermosulfurimonas dismutans TaxID=999894 RepID=A0A7C3CLE5_9BACT|nr:hypothetical protein [Thermosulfurimonas dismutans]